MKQHRVYQLFALLTKEELRHCAKFVRSPYFNTNPLIVALFDLLRKFYPSFAATRLTKEWLFAQLLGAQTYDAKRMRNLLSDLSLLLEKFFAVHQIQTDSGAGQDLLLAALAQKNAYPIF